jgi:GrpB-like predicted nucleotidyltransferase (UPF0157 family)
LITFSSARDDQAIKPIPLPRLINSAATAAECWSIRVVRTIPGGNRPRYAAQVSRHGPPAVEFREYDPNYPAVFEQLARRVQAVSPTAQLEHVGSTSVPGLGGRGVLDSVVIALPGEHAQLQEGLRRAGFQDFPYGAVQPGLTTTIRLADRDYEVVLYLIPADHDYLPGWRAFKKYMVEHPEEVERYAQVKREALAQGQTTPWAYQEAKTRYLVQLAQTIDTR